jgi:hypothetical protein
MHQNRILPCALFFGETLAVACKRLGGPSQPGVQHDALQREELRCGSFRRRDFLFRLRLLLFELEADFSILQLQISGEGTSLP